MMRQPPDFISSAKVLYYASNDENVKFVNAIKLIVNGKRLGEVSALAICQSRYSEEAVLLIFCDKNWENNGVIEVDSVAEAKDLAEKSYNGIGLNWIKPETRAELSQDSWPKNICAFCEKCSHDVFKVYSSENSAICSECIQLLNGFVQEDMSASKKNQD